MSSAILLSVAAGTALLSAGLLYVAGRRNEYSALVATRVRLAGGLDLGAQAPSRAQTFPVVLWVLDLLGRAGITPAPWQGWMIGCSVAAVAAVGGLWFGVFGAVIGAAIVVNALYFFILWRAHKRRQQIVEQLPGFLDHVIRALSAGNSVEGALMSATEVSADPVRAVFERVIRQVGLGGSLDSTLEQSARIYQLQELDILTLAVRVNQRYGGRIEATFKNIITMIRQRERARRELQSLTGETRFSAWVLVLESAALIAYIVGTNPTYLQGMWHDPVGWIILAVATGLQLTGSFILWRMVKSI